MWRGGDKRRAGALSAGAARAEALSCVGPAGGRRRASPADDDLVDGLLGWGVAVGNSGRWTRV
jgi:hypothetical protein